MSKTRSRKRKSASLRKPAPIEKVAPKSVDEYLAKVPQPGRDALLEMRAAIRFTVPADAIETISYRIPAFRTKKGVLVWFAAFSNHCSLFPTNSVIESFRDELKNFSTSKGTIHFPLDKPLPIPLIKEIVKTRAAQLENKRRR